MEQETRQIHCKKCGAHYDHALELCPYCGAENMAHALEFCPYCGAENMVHALQEQKAHIGRFTAMKETLLEHSDRKEVRAGKGKRIATILVIALAGGAIAFLILYQVTAPLRTSWKNAQIQKQVQQMEALYASCDFDGLQAYVKNLSDPWNPVYGEYDLMAKMWRDLNSAYSLLDRDMEEEEPLRYGTETWSIQFATVFHMLVVLEDWDTQGYYFEKDATVDTLYEMILSDLREKYRITETEAEEAIAHQRAWEAKEPYWKADHSTLCETVAERRSR